MALTHTLRSLARAPMFTIPVALAIAIGVGANTLVYSWFDSLIANPIPVIPAYDRLVAVNTAEADGSTGGAARISYRDFHEWRRQLTSFEAIGATAGMRLALRVDRSDHAESAWALLVTGDYFGALRVSPTQGRRLTPDDDRLRMPVAVVSDAFWRRQLEARPNPVGTQLQLNRVAVTVVGVLPPEFRGHEMGYAFDIWVPASLAPQLSGTSDLLDNRQTGWLAGVARLRDGVTTSAAGRELHDIARAVSQAGGDRPVTSAAVIPMREWRGGSVFTPILSTLLALTALVLLLSCASAATLILVRAMGRGPELATRMAMGSGRARLVRLLLGEVGLLALLGGAAGLIAAALLRPVISALVPPTGLPVFMDVRFGLRAFAFGAGITAVCLLLAGLAPAFEVGRGGLMQAVRRGGGVTGGNRRLLPGLVVVQLVFATVCLALASVFLTSLARARRVDVGFRNPEQILLTTLDFAAAGLDESTRPQTLERITERVAALPGVVMVSASTMAPLGFGGHRSAPVSVVGRAEDANERRAFEVVHVLENYFALMSISVADGRPILASDRRETEPVAVVNATFARRLQAGVGREIDVGGARVRIVGIVADGRYDDLRTPPEPVVFLAWRQAPRPSVILHVRARRTPLLLATAVGAAVTGAHPALVPLDVRTLAQHMEASTFVQRLGSAVLGVLAAMTLIIALVGVFGVVSFTLAQRTRELGVRLALGATTGSVRTLFVRRTLVWVTVAVPIGIVLAATAAATLANQLVAVRPVEPMLLGSVAALLLGATLLAGLIPTRRLSRIEPAGVLRA